MIVRIMFRAKGAAELPGDSKSFPAQKITDKTQWIKFNVGGSMLETTRRTVDKLQSSFLELLLDNEIQEIVNPLPEGVYRIDRDPEVFQVLLNYGRYGRIVGVPDHVTEEFILQEIAFYKMGHHVKDAVLRYFEQKIKGPNGIRVERISVTETAFKRKHKHHNSYGILGGGASISCYSGLPGGGTCYADVSPLFLYEKPHSKFPALFRATCMKCGHRVCFADDALIGLEGWCHKCHQCLRCQDILCEDFGSRHDGTRMDQLTARDQNEMANHLPSSSAAASIGQETEFIRKTATVVFIHEPPPPPPPAPIRNPGSPTPSDVSIGTLQNQAALDISRDKFKTDDNILKLPKLPQVSESPRLSNSFGRGLGEPATSRISEYPMSFGEYLSSGKWSL